jgi:hypothetical protein
VPGLRQQGKHSGLGCHGGQNKDVLLVRLFKVRIRLGHFDGATALQSIGPQDVCNPYALELRVRGFSIPVALPAAYLAAVYFGSWLLPLVFKRKEAYPRLAGAMDAYNVRASGERANPC